MERAKVDLTSRTQRRNLEVRPAPYFAKVTAGRFLGYYRGRKDAAGSWIARLQVAGTRHFEALGKADDLDAANGETVLDHGQAVARANAFFKERSAGGAAPIKASGPYTVAAMMADYFADREAAGTKGVAKDRSRSNVHILPALGALDANALVDRTLKNWRNALAKSPAMVRPKRLATEPRFRQEVDADDHDKVRARRASANRTLTVLKAAANLAFGDGHLLSVDAFAKVKPFKHADAPKVRYLMPDDCTRLVNVARDLGDGGFFASLLQGALLTGCRYGELGRMVASDFDGGAGIVTVRHSKAGKPRHVSLNDEGVTLFASLTAGHARSALIFPRTADGKKWKASEQKRPMAAASEKAKIAPAVSFHVMRHTYASALARAGVSMMVIAKQLGHADTRVTERNYAHLSTTHVSETVRAALPKMGIVQPTNVESFESRKRAVGRDGPSIHKNGSTG